MVNSKTLLQLVCALALFALGALWGQYAVLPAADAQAGEGTHVAPLGDAPMVNPVVATTPHAYVTEMDQDPFEPERIRRTRTTVTSVVVVYADGATAIRKLSTR